MIILTPYEIAFVGHQFNTAVIFLYSLILLQITQLKKKIGIYILFSSFIVMLAYASFLLFEIYDPVWVLFSRNVMIACTLGYLCVLLLNEKKHRVYTLIIGLIQGEFIFSMVVKKIGFSYPIGTGQFLDALASCFIVLGCWGVIEVVIVNLDHYMNQHIRGKQKTT
jgi:hypothetical protein